LRVAYFMPCCFDSLILSNADRWAWSWRAPSVRSRSGPPAGARACAAVEVWQPMRAVLAGAQCAFCCATGLSTFSRSRALRASYAIWAAHSPHAALRTLPASQPSRLNRQRKAPSVTLKSQATRVTGSPSTTRINAACMSVGRSFIGSPFGVFRNCWVGGCCSFSQVSQSRRCGRALWSAPGRGVASKRGRQQLPRFLVSTSFSVLGVLVCGEGTNSVATLPTLSRSVPRAQVVGVFVTFNMPFSRHHGQRLGCRFAGV